MNDDAKSVCDLFTPLEKSWTKHKTPLLSAAIIWIYALKMYFCSESLTLEIDVVWLLQLRVLFPLNKEKQTSE